MKRKKQQGNKDSVPWLSNKIRRILDFMQRENCNCSRMVSKRRSKIHINLIKSELPFFETANFKITSYPAFNYLASSFFLPCLSTVNLWAELNLILGRLARGNRTRITGKMICGGEIELKAKNEIRVLGRRRHTARHVDGTWSSCLHLMI